MPEREPWLARAAYVCGAVHLGLSQIFLHLIVDNPDHFWPSGRFYAFALLWAFVLPIVLVYAADAGLARLGRPWPSRAWRAALFAAVLLSFLKQIQSTYPRAFGPWLAHAWPLGVGAGLFAALAAAAWRWPVQARRYLVLMALLAIPTLGRYVVRTGVWGPAWRGAEAGAAPRSDAPPFVLLIFDELSMDILDGGTGRIDAGAFPSFARLAERSAWFSDATSHHAWTKDSLPSMLNGKIRSGRGPTPLLDLLGSGREVMIFDNVGGACFAWDEKATRATIGGTLRLASESPLGAFRILRRALSESAVLNTPLADTRTRGLPAAAWGGGEGAVDATLQFEHFEGFVNKDDLRGRAVVWHGWLPHAPFVFAADGTPHKRAEVTFNNGIQKKRDDPLRVEANYREQVRYVDRLLGRFLDRLRERGLDDDTRLVVTSDHGLRTWFGDLEPPDFPRVRSSRTPRVPLFIRAPGVAPGRRSYDYQHADLAPTILDLLGIPAPPGAFDGRSALKEGPPRRKIFFDEEQKPCVFDADSGLWKRLPEGVDPAF